MIGRSIGAVVPVVAPAENYDPSLVINNGGTAWISPAAALGCKTILANGAMNRARFSKIGDSFMSPGWLANFDTPALVDLGPYTSLQTGITTFAGSFSRASLGAHTGYTSGQILAGSPNMLALELTAWSPAICLVNLGLNNLSALGNAAPIPCVADLNTIADQCIASGSIPIFCTITEYTLFAAATLDLNTRIRAMAEGRRLPFYDVHFALDPYVDHGRDGSGSNVHPGPYFAPVPGSNEPAWFTAAALATTNNTPAGSTSGQNALNLLILKMLTQVQNIVLAA